jgi:hypothetical protein
MKRNVEICVTFLTGYYGAMVVSYLVDWIVNNV